MDLLCFILTCVAEDLHDTCSVLSHFLEELEAGFKVSWGAVCEGDAENYGIFNGLPAPLALICDTVMRSFRTNLVGITHGVALDELHRR
jgi:hypothetical protein